MESLKVIGREQYEYCWPQGDLLERSAWRDGKGSGRLERDMPECDDELGMDSRWPAFFPSPISFVTTGDRAHTALEKVVGATIVNRFPYVMALSFCRESLSDRHHPRRTFTEKLEQAQAAAVQFLTPGKALDAALDAIANVPDSRTDQRIVHSGLSARKAETNEARVFDDAYMVYEGRLVRPQRDFDGQPVYEHPWIDVGSHRVYFLEINAIQLREDIAAGRSQVHWRSLPQWRPQSVLQPSFRVPPPNGNGNGRYAKGYTPNYAFPAAGTVGFEADEHRHGMAIRKLAPLPQDQVEVDNDRARWPCFFPSSVGMITTWTDDGAPNVMPCGSTTVISRQPMIIAPCVSYARINERYAPRATLDIIRRRGRFGCGVPFIDEQVVDAIRYTGNHSWADDKAKVARGGLAVEQDDWCPVLPAMPIHFDCRVVGEHRLGTHVMFLGEVKRIRVRQDVTTANPLRWCPWAEVKTVDA